MIRREDVVMMALVVLVAGFVMLGSAGVTQAQAPATGQEALSQYVGHETCAMCHDAENELWTGSHHDLAMQPADPTTVLGDFDNATFTAFGVTSRFFRDGDAFKVRTEDAHGELRDYEIAYTFGVEPLQQYLVPFPGGRLQVLSICWDTRPRDQGGQRWFHLYPDRHVAPGDPLHWTNPDQNWNHMCAECHSTNLRKNYDRERDIFETSWSEIDVSCEACHGPGLQHVKWVESGPFGDAAVDGRKGFAFVHRDSTPVFWEVDVETGNALPQPERSALSVETCARCHSRRGIVHAEFEPGRSLLQTHRPALLEAGLYHADGQILDEVYVYGSFLQSKMYAAGVRCTDCHEPHSLRLRREGNSLCAACHQPSHFDTSEHHFHPAGSQGAQCVECHMPARNYMVVDPRRDHSLRIPRPDLSLEFGTPNACNDCHSDRSVEWAAQAVRTWYGDEASLSPHYAAALHAGRTFATGADDALAQLVGDVEQPAIVRATAAALLRANPGPATRGALQRALVDPAPLVRMGAVQALEPFDPGSRWQLAGALLDDAVRVVRLEAASALAGTPAELLSDGERQKLDQGVAEYRAAQLLNADRAEAHYNLGVVEERMGLLDAAEASYRTALRRDSTFTATYVNLADVYRQQERDAAGEEILRRGIAVAPDDGDLRHALGLALVRNGRHPEALAELERAATLRPERSRYAYVFAVALHSAGETERALDVLQEAQERHPGDRQLLLGLTTLNRDLGETATALAWARKLLDASPNDAQLRAFVEQLESELR